jgi:predicted enzyme related to lactoylglutathione lyase
MADRNGLSDPFEALRALSPSDEVAPDPAFTERLLARVERALALPKGVVVTPSSLEIEEQLAAGQDVPARSGDVAYVSLQVPDADRAAAFYSHVLGWTVGEPEAAGRARHVDHVRPSHGIFGGVAEPTLFICYLVADLEHALEAVVASGGTHGAPEDRPWGLTADCTDNQEMAFALYTPPAGQWPGRGPLNGERHGDVSYITMQVKDSALARAFYSAVLGWTFQPGQAEDGWGPEDVSVMMGLSGGHETMTCSPMYRVDDIETAVARVRELGGTATDIEERPYGLSSECRDDQGTHFWLGQH